MKLYPSLSDNLAEWAVRQPVFFTGSASTHGAHINVSPKGMTGTHFAVLSPNRCAYIDRTGSGCETISHAYENGRLCLMFMSFGPSPRIMRIFCRASVVEWDSPEFSGLVRRIAGTKRETFDGARAVIIGDIWQVQTSCGYAVPRVKRDLYMLPSAEEDKGGDKGDGCLDVARRLEDVLRQGLDEKDEKLDELAVFEERPTLDRDCAKKVGKMQSYQASNNAVSMDGIPGLKAARRDAGQSLWVGDAKARLRRAFVEKDGMLAGFMLAVFVYLASMAGTQLLVH